MTSTAGTIALHPEHLAAMAAHASFCLPNEACGLVATDRDGAIRMVYCLTNIDASPYRFTVDPAEHYHAWRHAKQRGWDIAGSFHSHPRAQASPSRSDIDGALDPEWVYFIVGASVAERPEVRAFRIRDGAAGEVELALRHL